jgi:DNA-binding beta-propeller fold protein YncE
MSTGRSRALAAAVAFVAATLAVPARGGTGILERFTPESGGFSVFAPSAAVPHPRGDVFFALVSNRLLASVDAATGDYITSFDLGLEVAAGLEAQPVAPMSISPNGRVLALVAAGAVRFFDVDSAGRIAARSALAMPTGTPTTVGFDADGGLAFVASGPVPASLVAVRTSDARPVDEVVLEAGETPIHLAYAAERSAVSVVTTRGVLVYRHDDRGRLDRTGAYARAGFVGDAFSGVEALGPRGRTIFTIEEGGSAVIALSLKGKQTAREPARQPNRYSTPVVTSPDGSKVVAVSVSGQTGNPVALTFFRGEGRGLKGNPIHVDLDPALGPVGQLAFDPDGGLLAASFPAAGAVVLVDAEAKEVVATSRAVGSPAGIAFRAAGGDLYVTGAAAPEPLTPLAQGAVTILPASRRGFDEAGIRRFDRLPGVLFGLADRAFTFASKFYAVASSGADDAVYTFNASSGALLERVEVGPSMGLLAVAPDTRTIVASGGGGLVVFRIDDFGHLTQVGPATPGAVPPERAPAVAFHPSLPLAYVTARGEVWRVDLETGASDAFAIGADLTSPAVGAGRLVAIDEGGTLVRCALDGAGRPTVAERVALGYQVSRVAFDAAGLRMWASDGQIVREYSLVSGGVVRASAPGVGGRAVVLVAPDLLAVLPDGAGEVTFLDAALQVAGQVALDAAPSGMGPAADASSRRLFVPLATGLVAVGLEGAVSVDDAASPGHVSFVRPLERLAYVDLGGFPGSVFVARGF